MDETSWPVYKLDYFVSRDYVPDYPGATGAVAEEHYFTRATEDLTMKKHREGTGLKNWREIIKRGGNATTPYTGYRNRVINGQGSMTLHSRHPPTGGLQNGWTFDMHAEGMMQGIFTSKYSGPSISLSEVTANNRALVLVLRKIRQERTRFQGQIFLGEFAESIRMLSSPAKALRKGIGEYLNAVSKRTKGLARLTYLESKAARHAPSMVYDLMSKQERLKRKVSEASKIAKQNERRAVIARESLIGKAIADTWLEYSFGWAPLINDIQDAQKAFRHLTERTYGKRLSGQGGEETTVCDSGTGHFHDIYCSVFITDVQRVSVKYTVGMRSRTFAYPGQTRLFEQFGLVTEQFIPTVWELLPWSFLVDYFTNIGDILDANATNVCDVTWVSKTVKKTQEQSWLGYADRTLNNQAWPLTADALVEGSIGTPRWTSESVVRSNPGELSFPSFTVNIPSSPIQWINMGALSFNLKRLTSFRN